LDATDANYSVPVTRQDKSVQDQSWASWTVHPTNIVFPSTRYGLPPQVVESVTIRNNRVGNLSFNVSDLNNFTISRIPTYISAKYPATINIYPKPNLPIGKYNEVLEIKANNEVKTVFLSFEVTPNRVAAINVVVPYPSGRYFTNSAKTIHFYEFNPLATDPLNPSVPNWCFKLNGYKPISELADNKERKPELIVNATYFTPGHDAIGVNYFNGDSLNSDSNYDGMSYKAYRRLDSKFESCKRVLFYYRNKPSEILKYTEIKEWDDVTDKESEWKAGKTKWKGDWEAKAKEALFVITGDMGMTYRTEPRERTAIGVKGDGIVIIAASDIDISGDDIYAELLSQGAINIIVLDGGSSTQMYANGEMKIKPKNSVGSIIVVYASGK